MAQFTTGQPTVDAIGKLNFEGNLVPHTWLKHLTYTNKRATYTHHLAVLLLADIVYWYRPKTIIDEPTGRVLGWKKKFQSNQLHRSYEQIAEQLGATYKQAREAVLFLKSLNLITAELRNFTTATGLFVSNALFLEPVVEEIIRITYSTYSTKDEPRSEIGKPDAEIGNGDAEIGRTYTETSPEITSKTSKENTHIRQAENARVSNQEEVAANSEEEKEASQVANEFADRVIPDPSKRVGKKKVSHVANKSSRSDQPSATFDKPEQLKNKVVEDVEELLLNTDGTRRYPWNKRGSSRHCHKFARWLFLNHLCKCGGYNDGRGFESHKVQVLAYLDRAKDDLVQAEMVADFWNSYIEAAIET
jgi:hypothetical protein